jgi:beta-glucanase (GH16 family)
MKLKFFLLLISFLYAITSYSQISENRYNVNYVATSLFEDFSSGLNRWSPTAHLLKGTGSNENPFIFVDSVSTVHIDSYNRLQLTMINYPNYTTTDYDNHPISANYIAGEINSNQDFSYGIYECNARFANDHGSFPAFWLYCIERCEDSYINEIDIAECKVHIIQDCKITFFTYLKGVTQNMVMDFWKQVE